MPNDATPRFRRAVLLRSLEGRVEGEVVDDFHHFGVVLVHDGETVTSVEAWAERFPWATCGGATASLKAIEGVRISDDPTGLFVQSDPLVQCTHMFELAAFAMAQAASGAGERLYESEVTDAVEGRREVRIWRDGTLLLDCVLDGEVIQGSVYAGRNVFAIRSKDIGVLGRDEAELLLVLRRVSAASRGRRMDLDAVASVGAMPHLLHCHTGRPEVVGGATRVMGATRDYSGFEGAARGMLTGRP